MTYWTPCPILVGEPDYWDAEACSRRRQLSGVAQGIEDLRTVEIHYQRDPDEAVAAWETYARDADDDGMATFNAFVKGQQRDRTLSGIGFAVRRLGLVAGGFQAAGAVWRTFTETAAEFQSITARLENTAQALGLEIEAVRAEFKEYAAAQPFPIAESLPYFLNRLHSRASSTPIALSVTVPDSSPASAPRLCYRCATAHGSKPCRQTMRGRR